MSQLLWCVCPVYLSPRRSSPKSHQGSIGKIPHPQGKNSTPCGRHHFTVRVLSQKHILFFPRTVLWTGQGCGYQFPGQPHCSLSIYGVLWAKGSQYCPTPQILVQVCGWHICHPKGNPQAGLPMHINSVDLAIQFTVQNNKEDGAIPFLNTIVKPEADGKLSTTVYRKPTHTDQYLQWDNHQSPLSQGLVLSTPCHIGPKQYAAILTFSTKRRPTSGMH